MPFEEIIPVGVVPKDFGSLDPPAATTRDLLGMLHSDQKSDSRETA